MQDLLRTKDEAVATFRRFLAKIKSWGYSVRRLRVDNDSVFLGQEFMGLLATEGVVPELTAPYAHWQHGRVERQWGTQFAMAKSMLHQASLDRQYWGLAMSAAAYLRNRVWSSGAGGIPYKIVTGKDADYTRLRVFGCPAYVHVDKSNRGKLEDSAWRGVFVGYAVDSSPSWLVYNPRTRRVIRSRNVVFDEHAVMGEKGKIPTCTR